MSPCYTDALTAAGATVHVSESFGSYQGDTWALVAYEGRAGWVCWSFGSCSGCDDLERWVDETRTRLGLDWDDDIPSSELAAFGRNYLDNIMDQATAEAKASEDIDWDQEAEKVLAFLKSNPIPEST